MRREQGLLKIYFFNPSILQAVSENAFFWGGAMLLRPDLSIFSDKIFFGKKGEKNSFPTSTGTPEEKAEKEKQQGRFAPHPLC